MSAPSAWIPFRVVASALFNLARSMKLVSGSPLPSSFAALPDGRKSIAVQGAGTDEVQFPIVESGGVVSLPPMMINFHTWIYIAPTSLGGMPTTGTHWIRLTIEADTSSTMQQIEGDEPVNVTYPLPAPTFAWHDEALGLPDYEAGIPTFGSREYYWYLVQVIEGVIQPTIGSPSLAAYPQVFD
jgi:hypothetical protein